MKLRFRPHHAPRFRTEQPHEDRRVTTLPVPGFRQTRDYTCGFATALMVLRYFDAPMPAMELFQRLGTGPDGTRQSALLRELRAAGLRVNARYDVDFARICREIERNKLIIGYLADVEHWLVIYGYGLAPARVFVADPEPEQACQHPWASYGPRLGGFGIICSQGGGETGGVRQTPLELQEPSEPAEMTGPPPPPVAHLRCEVHTLAPAVEPVSPQLPLPFENG
jgi:hypothetical protein